MQKYAIHLSLAALFLTAAIHSALAGEVRRFQVDGLACPFCSYGVEKQLKAIPGVRGVKVSIKSGTVTVTMKDGAKLTRAQADKAVKAAGFTMRNFR